MAEPAVCTMPVTLVERIDGENGRATITIDAYPSGFARGRVDIQAYPAKNMRVQVQVHAVDQDGKHLGWSSTRATWCSSGEVQGYGRRDGSFEFAVPRFILKKEPGVQLSRFEVV